MVHKRMSHPALLIAPACAVGAACGVGGLLLWQYARRQLRREIARAYRDFASFQSSAAPTSYEGDLSHDNTEG